MNIILITGGPSSEREVSLSSGRSILKALRELGHKVTVVDPVNGSRHADETEIFSKTVGRESPSADELDELKKSAGRKILECFNSEIFDGADLAFIGLHGKFGEDGRIQTLLELRGVRYTGSDVFSSGLAMDKNISKMIMSDAGVKTPESIAIDRKEVTDYKDLNRRILETIGYPCVVKPNDEGSTVGLSIVNSDAEDVQLPAAAETAFRYSERILIERMIKGRELTVPVIGDEAFPVIEIRPKGGFYDYEHKYTKGMTEYFCPADIPADTEKLAKENSLKAHRSLGCSVYSRVDYILDGKGELYCLEVNTLPGMTETSLVPKSAAASGMSFAQLMQRIIDLSLSKN